MTKVTQANIPEDSALNTLAQENGVYSDCFAAEVTGALDLSTYLDIFFSTPLFQLEARILRLQGVKNGTDADRHMFAAGEVETFSGWVVVDRRPNEVLLSVGQGPIHTWFRLEPLAQNGEGTRLLFGSAATPTKKGRDGQLTVAASIRFLAPLHRLYSRMLLAAAVRSCQRRLV